MKAYRVVDGGPDWKTEYRATLSDAKGVAANDIPEWHRDGLRIEQVEFVTDQKTICGILSGWGCEMKVLRTWAMTPRGGLKEVSNGE